jgi:hypothetical protein
VSANYKALNIECQDEEWENYLKKILDKGCLYRIRFVGKNGTKWDERSIQG